MLTITPEPATKAWPHPFARLGLSLQRGLEPLRDRYPLPGATRLGAGRQLRRDHSRPQPPARGSPTAGRSRSTPIPRLNHDLPFVDLDSALATLRAADPGGPARLARRARGRGGRAGGAAQRRDRLRARSARTAGQHPHAACRAGHAPAGLPQRAGRDHRGAGARGPDGQLAAGRRRHDLRGADPQLAAARRSTSCRRPRRSAPRCCGVPSPCWPRQRAIVQALKPSAALLPEAARRLDAVVTAATPVFRQAPRLAAVLTGAAAAIDALARDPAAAPDLQGARGQRPRHARRVGLRRPGGDPAVGLERTVRLQRGRAVGAQLRLLAERGGQQRHLAALHADPQRRADASSRRPRPRICTSTTTRSRTPASARPATRSTRGAQLIGNPPTTSRTVDNTSPPPGSPGPRRAGGAGAVRRRARRRRAAPARDHGGDAARAVRGHLLRLQPGPALRPQVHAQRARRATASTSARGIRCGSPGSTSGRSSGVAPAGQTRPGSPSPWTPTACPSTATPRCGSATACSWRAATTSISTRAPRSAPVIADGGRIPLAQTSSPVQFFQVLSTFDVAARANLKTLVAQLATGFGPGRGRLAGRQRRRRAAQRHPLAEAGPQRRRGRQSRPARHPARGHRPSARARPRR